MNRVGKNVQVITAICVSLRRVAYLSIGRGMLFQDIQDKVGLDTAIFFFSSIYIFIYFSYIIKIWIL